MDASAKIFSEFFPEPVEIEEENGLSEDSYEEWQPTKLPGFEKLRFGYGCFSDLDSDLSD